MGRLEREACRQAASGLVGYCRAAAMDDVGTPLKVQAFVAAATSSSGPAAHGVANPIASVMPRASALLIPFVSLKGGRLYEDDVA